MSSFEVTPEVIADIAGKFGISEGMVDKIYGAWCQLAGLMKKQYLAHVSRAMEQKIRDLTGNKLFQILCVPIPRNVGRTQACYKKGQYFAAFYYRGKEEKQLRIELAHELGHLFLLELFNSYHAQHHDESTPIEPHSTIMGIFTILEKNKFYHGETLAFMHDSPDEILKAFLKLHASGGRS